MPPASIARMMLMLHSVVSRVFRICHTLPPAVLRCVPTKMSRQPSPSASTVTTHVGALPPNDTE
jgi:hypothetical protein